MFFARTNLKLFRSTLERIVAAKLKAKKKKYEYESIRLSYQLPISNYIPDFVFNNSNTIWEVKGRFVLDDRRKHLALKEQQPEWEIRFIFSNAKAKLYKGGKMTYGGWCDKHGFKYCHREIPEDWFKNL